MDISAAIDQLTKFKKLSKALGECDLVGLDNESFVVKVKFNDSRSRDAADSAPAFPHHPVLGFSQRTA